MSALENGSVSAAVTVPSLTALERLRQMKESRATLLREMRRNWPGWLFSFCLHGSVLVLAVVLYVNVPLPPSTTTVQFGGGYNDAPILSRENLGESLTGTLELKMTDQDPSQSAGTAVEKSSEPSGGGAGPYFGLSGELVDGPGRGPGRPGTGLPGLPTGGPQGKPGVPITVIQEHGLDIVFVFDSTGSMGAAIRETQERIRMLVEVMNYLVPGKVRVGLVTYRDKQEFTPEDYGYTTKFCPLTTDVKKLQRFLNETEAFGGGDIPEAVYDGLEQAISQLGWTKPGPKTPVKVIVIFGDAPPRPENDGLKKVYDLAERWHKATSGYISCIDTTGNNQLMPEFRQIASSGGGDATSLQSERELVEKLAIYVFGVGNQREVQRALSYVDGRHRDVNVIYGDQKPDKP